MRTLLDILFLVVGYFPFITLSILCHLLLAFRVSAEKSADDFIGVHTCVICGFILAAFSIFSLSLILVSLINMCLGMFFLGLILYGAHCASWIWVSNSHVREGFSYYLTYFLWLFLSILSFWHLYNENVVHLKLSQGSYKLFSFIFILFSLFCSPSVISTSLSFTWLIPSPFYILLLVPSNEFFFFLVFCPFRATPEAYGGSQANAASLYQSHSNAGSDPHLWPTPQLTAMLDP